MRNYVGTIAKVGAKKVVVLDYLGEGGHSHVFRVTDCDTKEIYVLKRMALHEVWFRCFTLESLMMILTMNLGMFG